MHPHILTDFDRHTAFRNSGDSLVKCMQDVPVRILVINMVNAGVCNVSIACCHADDHAGASRNPGSYFVSLFVLSTPNADPVS